MPVTPVITRFAPSPTGALHLGHAYAALVAWRAARQAGGRFLVRLEDIDGPRMRPAYVQAILDDLTWLGLPWDGEVLRQSTRMAAYKAALDRLAGMDLLYPCFCTRAEIRAEIDRAGSAPHPAAGREGSAGDGSGDGMTPPYPGTCRALAASERAARLAAGEPHALRLPMDQALAKAGPHLVWHDRRRGEQVADPAPFGDIVLARKDIPASYHLAVTVDDAAQGITLVTRGEDLFAASHIHRLLQALLGLPVPDYLHHPLVVDGRGKRLAKRDDARSLAALRARNMTAQHIKTLLEDGEARCAAGLATAIQGP